MELLEPITIILPKLKTVLLAIVPLGFLIFIHELGHFLAAKRAGIKVTSSLSVSVQNYLGLNTTGQNIGFRCCHSAAT